MKWEYLIAAIGEGENGQNGVLPAMGEGRWELVAVVSRVHPQHGEYVRGYFKRPKAESAPGSYDAGPL